jgi:importin-5
MAALVDPLLNVLPPLLAEKDSQSLSAAVKSLIEVAAEHPKMFRHPFSGLVQFALSVVKEKQLENDPRQNAMELLVTFAETEPGMCRKDPNYTIETVEQTLAFMCDHDDDPQTLEDWRTTDDVISLQTLYLTIVGL